MSQLHFNYRRLKRDVQRFAPSLALAAAALAPLGSVADEKDRTACRAYAAAFSDEAEAMFRVFSPPKVGTQPRWVDLLESDRAMGGRVELLGNVKLPNGSTYAAIVIPTGGTCGSDEIVLARRHADGRYSVVSSIKDIDEDDDLRWDFMGSYGSLVKINGRLYQARGRFASRSEYRSANQLYRLKGTQWVKACDFTLKRVRYRLSGPHPACRAVEQGDWSRAEPKPVPSPAEETVMWMLSGSQPGVAPSTLRIDAYFSGAGCGTAFRWAVVDDEFRGLSRSEILSRGAPKTLLLMMPAGDQVGLSARGALEEFIEHYHEGPSATGPRYPTRAVSSLYPLSAGGYDALLMTNLNPLSSRGDDDLALILADGSGPAVKCTGRERSEIAVGTYFDGARPTDAK